MEDQQGQTQKQPEKPSEQPQTNGTVVQEASSTTPSVEVPTKRSIRVQTWKKIQEDKCGVSFSKIFNRIPDFIGSEKAAALLAETPEFKSATNIKVNIDRAQDPIKNSVLSSGKNLYVSPSRDSNAIYTKIDSPPPPADAAGGDEETAAKAKNAKELRHDIDFENKVKLDMVVIGSVAVSRDGYRIGRGNGFVDLDVCMLIQTGAITADTVIVTTVHDIQVSDSFPLNLFQKYDVPIDLIVTPTEVIRVEKRLPRPTGLFWEILSERRLKIVPVLKVIKENEEKQGKVITLKSEDTDVESTSRPQQHQRRNHRFRYRNRRTKSETQTENNGNNIEKQDRPKLRRKNRFVRGKKPSKSDGEQSANEKENNHQNRKKRTNRDFCIKVSNIARGIRIKDLKAELRKRNCNPIYISWKGAFGRCFLHFAKRAGTERQSEIDSVLKSLNDLSITYENGEEPKTVALGVELLKIDDPQHQQQQQQQQQEATIEETVDTTAV